MFILGWWNSTDVGSSSWPFRHLQTACGGQGRDQSPRYCEFNLIIPLEIRPCGKNVDIFHTVHPLFLLLSLVWFYSTHSSSKRGSCWNLHCPSGFRGRSSCCVYTRKSGRWEVWYSATYLLYNKNKGVNFNVPHISFLLLTGVGCWEMGRNEQTSDRCEAFKGIFMLSLFLVYYSVPLSREYQRISPTLTWG